MENGRDLVPATASADILVQVPTNGGTSYYTTSGHYIWGRVYESVTQSLALGAQNNQSASGFSRLPGTGANIAKMDGTMGFYNPITAPRISSSPLMNSTMT
jgi:hypothetical protein